MQNELQDHKILPKCKTYTSGSTGYKGDLNISEMVVIIISRLKIYHIYIFRSEHPPTTPYTEFGHILLILLVHLYPLPLATQTQPPS